MGFLAQDVEAVLGDGYSVLGIGADKQRTLSLRYTDLIAPMVKAIQEQQATIQSQQASLDSQQAQIEGLTAKLAASDVLRTQLETVTARLAALEKVATARR